MKMQFLTEDLSGLGLSPIQLISSVLVLLGAIVLGRSMFVVVKTHALVKSIDRKKQWMVIHSLMYFFLVGYVAAIICLFVDQSFWLELLVGVVFAAGAVFVSVTLQLGYESIKDINLRRDRYTHLVNEVKDYAIVMLDSKGFVWSWNRGAEQIKGYTTEEALWLDYRKFYTDDDVKAGKPDQLLEEARSIGRAQDEGWRVRKDGSQFWALVSITALRDENGIVVSFSKVTRDLTERKRSEDQQRRHMDLLEAKNKELEQFTYIASHDLQEPLTTLQGLVEILKEEAATDNDEVKQVLGFINDTTGRMSQLVKGLLDHGRLGIGKQKATINTAELIEDVLNDLKSSIKTSGGRIIVESGLPSLYGYELELRMLFQNLIGNALKFRDPQRLTEVNVSAVEHLYHWEFIVSDNGLGIKKEHFKKIFVIFQQLHNRGEFEGTGIGLAHCRKIVELHGGKIWVASELGIGSKFHFTIMKGVSANGTEEKSDQNIAH